MSALLSAFRAAACLALISAAESFLFLFNFKVWRLRWLLFSHYFMRRYWVNPADQDQIYGETPFWTMRKICLWAGLRNGAVVWDLGCGRGLTILFCAVYFGARAVGVETSPLFVQVGALISRKMGLKTVTWIQNDFLSLDLATLPKPDLVYLAATTFAWETILSLTRKLENLPSGTKVISLSAPLPSRAFKELGRRELWFSWGKATAHLHEKV